MRCDANLRKRIYLKIVDTKPYLSVVTANDLLFRLLGCDDILGPNILEWLENKPFSEIWICDKYCVNAVMKIRGNEDFISAVIALDDYLKEKSKEFAIWQPRA